MRQKKKQKWIKFNSNVFVTHCLRLCLQQFVGIPTTSNFGLIFKDKFAEMKMPAADLTLIININSALSMALGLINGPLLRYFGYRRISIVAALLFSVGLMLTALTDTIFGLIISYGVITGSVYLLYLLITPTLPPDFNLCWCRCFFSPFS